MKKVLLKSLIYIYNVFSKGRLKFYYNKIKHNNDLSIPINDEEIEFYLNKWNIKQTLSQCKLMTKNDIIKWVKQVDNKDIKSWAYTGGSYGEPLKIPYSQNRNLVRTATFLYFNEIGGYNIGDPFVLIRAKNKNPLLKFLRNEYIVIPLNISTEELKNIVSTITKKNIKVILGYPSVIFDIALYLKNNPKLIEKVRVRSIISVSEMLDDTKRETINKVFKCRFIDRYSIEEVGLIAQQKEYRGEYYTNKFGVYVEVIDPVTLKPTIEGDIGKVVVTDLENDLVPIIRYDTGDLAEVGYYKDGKVHTLKRILGREAEAIFRVNGDAISSLALGPLIYKPLTGLDKTHQFQFAQLDKKNYELRLVGDESDIPKLILDHIVDDLAEVLGKDAKIAIKILKQIPTLPSGKIPVYKNEQNQNATNAL